MISSAQHVSSEVDASNTTEIVKGALAVASSLEASAHDIEHDHIHDHDAADPIMMSAASQDEADEKNQLSPTGPLPLTAIDISGIPSLQPQNEQSVLPKLARLGSMETFETTELTISCTDSVGSLSPRSDSVTTKKITCTALTSDNKKEGDNGKTIDLSACQNLVAALAFVLEDSPPISSSFVPSENITKAQEQERSPATTTTSTSRVGRDLPHSTSQQSNSAASPHTCSPPSPPKRSIFGPQAMDNARQSSSLPRLPTEEELLAVAAFSYTPTPPVRKACSTDVLVQRRRSCLRSINLYTGSNTTATSSCSSSSSSSSSSRKFWNKMSPSARSRSASTLTTSNTTSTPAAPAPPATPLPRPRSSSAVKFSSQVQVFEFHRSHHELSAISSSSSSQDWSSFFA